MQKLWIIMTYDISVIGGTQTYTAAKAKILAKNGWKVIVFYPDGNCNFMIPYLERYKKGNFYQLQQIPQKFHHLERKIVLKKMIQVCKPSQEAYKEIIIESHYDSMHFWGELLASKLRAKHFCLCLNEEYRSSKKHYKENLDFYDFKYERGELNGDLARLNKLFDGHRTINNENPFLITENPIENVFSSKVNNLKKYDYNICLISRMEKVYIPEVCRQIAIFASNHLSSTIQIVLVGDTKNCEEMINKTFSANNIIVTRMGNLYPIPKDLYKRIDVCVGGSGCALYSAAENSLTISIDAITGLAIGLLGYETQHSLYMGEEDNPTDLSDALERVLIVKKYKEMPYIGVNAKNSEECYQQNLKVIAAANRKKAYYSEQKLCKDCIAISFRTRISLMMEYYFPRQKKFLKKIIINYLK